jgi:hypothetical protein
MQADLLRYAILTEGSSFGAVYGRALEAFESRGDTICVAVITVEPRPPETGLLYRRLFPDAPAMKSRPLPETLSPQPRLSSRDTAAISALRLDFVLSCLPHWDAAEGGIPAVYGVWRWFYGTRGTIGEAPPAFWEIHDRMNSLEVTLERIGPGGGVLKRGVVKTDPTSHRATLNTALLATADFPALVARKIRITGSLDATAAPRPAARPRPGFGSILSAATKMAAAQSMLQIRSIFYSEIWSVGVVNAPIQSFLDPRFKPAIDWLPRFPDLKFVADPFVLRAEGEGLELLVEEFDFDRYQGYITSLRYTPTGVSTLSTNVIIDEGVHMSYPYPVRYNGQLYCIPECHTRREVCLYRFDQQQHQWKRDQTLLSDFAALDSTVIERDGKWWLFCTSQDDFSETKLYIFHANHLFGPWQPHPLNPVQCDARGSRPGGTFFEYNGDFYRPAQDSTSGYGGALTINRVSRLSTIEFEEAPVIRLAPQRGYWRDGIHTLSAGDGMTVVDGKRIAWTSRLIARRLRHKVKRIAGLASAETKG